MHGGDALRAPPYCIVFARRGRYTHGRIALNKIHVYTLAMVVVIISHIHKNTRISEYESRHNYTHRCT